MTFEKEFPSLKKVICKTFTAKCLMKTCVDKAKVKEAIEAMVHGIDAPDKILIDCQNYIYKELGWK